MDLCSIPRIKRALRNPGFAEKVFHRDELEYALDLARPEESLAGSFAAREALAKALGIGLSRLGLKGAWVRRGPSGPMICFDDRMSEYMDGRGVKKSFLSISHEASMAVAVVVLEGGD